ncbi:MAG: hypothetical protein HYV07_32115 [Deltaproteobacteria bacterium]|nr:hypothetical protein [Deltaproteobacteria bacterium]
MTDSSLPHPSPRFLVSAGGRDASPRAIYRLAGGIDLLAPVLQELRAFEVAGAKPLESTAHPVSLLGLHSVAPNFDEVAFVFGTHRRVRTQGSAEGYRIEVDGSAPFTVSRAGRIEWPPGLSEAEVEDVARVSLLGPGLILALALRDIFCIHASAVSLDGRAALFVGRSGAGKSTLAARLGSRFFRLTDDITPLVGALPSVDPAYPQLKLRLEEQSTALGVGATRLWRIYALESALDVSIAALPPAASLQLLVAQSVAARLFAPDLLARHFATVADWARRIPVRALRYPRRFDVLDDVRAAVEADLSGPD